MDECGEACVLMNDLYKALGMLSNGVNRLATSRAVMGANEAVQKTIESDLDEQQKFNQMRQISTDLAMRLTGLSANPQSISAATNSFAPRENIQSIQGALFSQDPSMRKRAQEIFDQQQEAQLEQQSAKAQEKQAKMLRTELDTFQNKFVKNEFDALEAVGTLRTLLGNGENVSNLNWQMAARKLLKLSGEERISDQDIRAVAPDPSLFAKVKRAAKLALKGKVPTADVEIANLTIQAMEHAARRQIQEKAKNFAQGRRGLLTDITPEELAQRLVTQTIGAPVEEAAAPAAATTQQPGGAPNFGNYLIK